MKRILHQAIQFVGISGIGWLIDFTIFNILTLKLPKVDYCNMISSMVAVCFVFAVSTRKTFVQSKSKISLKMKFAIYVLYQVVLIILISKLLSWMSSEISILFAETILAKYSAMLSKIFVTPITMATNFCVMKLLIEKL